MKTSEPARGIFTVLFVLAFLTGGCDKSTPPSPDNQSAANRHESQPPPKIEAEPFREQVYESLGGGTVRSLTLISKDECELAQGNTILLCKYTKQNDKLRIVTTALGTSQVVYYRFTYRGLEDNDGHVLISPEYSATLHALLQRQKQEEERQRQERQQAK